MSGLHAVVLAAGKGTRLRSDLAKVLHQVSGLPLIEHVIRSINRITATSTTLIVGHQADEVIRTLRNMGRLDVHLVRQVPQLGTGHALLQAESVLTGETGTVLLLSGDVPLLRPDTIRRLLDVHEAAAAAMTILTGSVADPSGYGRIARGPSGDVIRIVEDRDATAEQREITEINSGIYAFDLDGLFDALRKVGTANAQREYYLPDLVELFRAQGRTVASLAVDDPSEILGINTRAELAVVGAIMRRQKTDELMATGVTVVDPASTYVDPDVRVGPDTIIRPGVYLEGGTRIGARCTIHSGVRIVNSEIGDDVEVRNFCVIVDSRVANGAAIGPFAHLRPQSDVGAGAHIGNFVELKKTHLGAGSKANHLAYLGDATIGERVNIGAGTITCNYDGRQKHATVIEDGAFVGTNSSLVAPLRIGRDAYVAAGSTVTEDVPAESLAVGRGRQVNKEGWARRAAQRPPKREG